MRYVVGVLVFVSFVVLLPSASFAFCGFYVSDAKAPLYNNATRVVMMRGGTKTVLSMQNDYVGPPQDFALVVPVPQVLQKKNVKTLSRSVFEHVERLGAPRLVEYWEQDPCGPPPSNKTKFYDFSGIALDGRTNTKSVAVKAKFSVGEYDVVVLSASDAAGLDSWLRAHKYNIPKGAEPFFKPYVDSGMYFFVAKVNAKRLKFHGKKAVLSPLRFHYDSKDFQLPVRLGLINSKGQQDLIINILAEKQRYEVANHPNVFIPTNLEVTDEVRHQFPAFYEGLLDAVYKKNPKAVVTEYAWASGKCDPCPRGVAGLTSQEILNLGGDVLGISSPVGMVMTRLHARYGKGTQADLVFRAAQPVVGGSEIRSVSKKEGRELQAGATPANANAFQARYIIRHLWTKKVECQNPRRGFWGHRAMPAQNIRVSPIKASPLRNRKPKLPKATWADTFERKKFKIKPKKFVVGGQIDGL